MSESAPPSCPLWLSALGFILQAHQLNGWSIQKPSMHMTFVHHRSLTILTHTCPASLLEFAVSNMAQIAQPHKCPHLEWTSELCCQQIPDFPDRSQLIYFQIQLSGWAIIKMQNSSDTNLAAQKICWPVLSSYRLRGTLPQRRYTPAKRSPM